MRYADWANRTENFSVKITQSGVAVFSYEFGARDRVDPHDEVSMYWGWAFNWDSAPAFKFEEGIRASFNRDREGRTSRVVMWTAFF